MGQSDKDRCKALVINALQKGTAENMSPLSGKESLRPAQSAAHLGIQWVLSKCLILPWCDVVVRKALGSGDQRGGEVLSFCVWVCWFFILIVFPVVREHSLCGFMSSKFVKTCFMVKHMINFIIRHASGRIYSLQALGAVSYFCHMLILWTK